MIYEICAAIALVIFAILAYYIYRTMVSLQHTLNRVDVLTFELTAKIQKLDSTMRSISNLGDVAEEESIRFRENYMLNKQLFRAHSAREESSDDLTDLLVAGLKVGANYLRRK
jgi:hypothetical protein